MITRSIWLLTLSGDNMCHRKRNDYKIDMAIDTFWHESIVHKIGKVLDKLKKQNKTLPNQTNKEVQNPTVRWIYSMFSNVGRYIFSDNESFCVGLTDFQQRTIELLGDNWLQMYRHFFMIPKTSIKCFELRNVG